MDATNTPKINLINNLRQDFSQFQFELSDNFHWSNSKNTVFYPEIGSLDNNFYNLSLLHELAHAILVHSNYNLDIDLLKIETEAWDLASKVLAPKYSIDIEDNFIQDNLDTYRDWMHHSSLCPNCNINGFQQSDLRYKCPSCGKIWQPNEAKFTMLRRYNKK